MRWIFCLHCIAHAIALNGLGENHGRLTCVLCRCRESGINFIRIMTAAIQTPDIIITHARNHLKQLGMFAKEMIAHEFSIIGFERLVFTVDGFFHDLAQDAFFIARK